MIDMGSFAAELAALYSQLPEQLEAAEKQTQAQREEAQEHV